MRKTYDEELKNLNESIIEMGILCEKIMTKAITSIDNYSELLKTEVYGLEEEIDRSEHEIENLILRIILRNQPVASDLRKISAGLKIITDMERIGDMARDIVDISKFLPKDIDGTILKELRNMSEFAKKMVETSIDAYVLSEIKIAEKVILDDDVVDNYFVEIRDMLVEIIRTKQHRAAAAIDVIMVAKYIERIADHATNIATWVTFVVTGFHSPKRV